MSLLPTISRPDLALESQLPDLLEEPLADGSGWRLRFDVSAGQTRLVVRRVARLDVSLSPAAGAIAIPASACVGYDGAAEIWMQRGDERFEAQPITSCRPDGAAALALREGDRIVSDGRGC